METLIASANNFLSYVHQPLNDSSKDFHRIGEFIHDQCRCILEAEALGVSKAEIREALNEVHEIYGRSAFIKRLQTWPRGYPGDFETIEYLCDQVNKSKTNTFEYYLESFALNSPIAQQHRNKIHAQADLVLDAIFCNGNTRPKILVIASGGCRDIRQIQKYLVNRDFELVINDMEPLAIEFCKQQLQAIQDKCTFVVGNIIETLKELIGYGPYDLILAGGLMDYLPDELVTMLLSQFRKKAMNPAATFFFTNMAENNPYRVWIEHLADWVLIERSEDKLVSLARDAGFLPEKISTSRDQTGLTVLVDAHT